MKHVRNRSRRKIRSQRKNRSRNRPQRKIRSRKNYRRVNRSQRLNRSRGKNKKGGAEKGCRALRCCTSKTASDGSTEGFNEETEEGGYSELSK